MGLLGVDYFDQVLRSSICLSLSLQSNSHCWGKNVGRDISLQNSWLRHPASIRHSDTPGKRTEPHFHSLANYLTIPQIFGADRGVMFALGALAAVGYVIILENAADNIASGNQDTISKLQGNARFAMPVLAVGAVGLKNYITNPDMGNLLSTISKDDFAALMIGFVTPSRLPLLYREIRASLKGEELLDMLPGSIGQGRKMLKGMDEERVVEKTPSAPSSAAKIVVVSGPRYLGKTTVFNRMLAEDDRLTAPVWCTARPLKSSEVDGRDVNVLKPIKFEDLQRKGSFLHTYQDQDRELYGLRVEDIKAVSERGKVRSISLFNFFCS